MYTVRELVSILGVATENQVRNRIEAIRDLLLPHLRRGPNNQLLVSAEGLRLLRDLQALCETGHTIKEAANILRFKAEEIEYEPAGVSHETRENQEKGWQALVEHLAAEVRELRERVGRLEARVLGKEARMPWWERFRGVNI